MIYFIVMVLLFSLVLFIAGEPVRSSGEAGWPNESWLVWIPASTLQHAVLFFIKRRIIQCVSGRVFGLLQLVLAVTELLSNVFFTSIYPLTLSWFAGFCFLLSSGISYMSTVPILWVQLPLWADHQKNVSLYIH